MAMDKVSQKRLEKLGFQLADGVVLPRLILCLSGMEKTGKTHFALTAPGPIAFFNTDVGMEGVVGKFLEDKEVLVYHAAVPGDAEKAKEVWSHMYDAYRSVLVDSAIRTLVVDTATEVWELLRYARFGQLTQVMPFQYGPVNAEYRKWLRLAYDSQKNVIMIHKMKPVYINDKRTKDYEPAGFSDMKYVMQVNAQTWKDDPEDLDEGEAKEHHIYIKDCRQNTDIEGLTLDGDLCNFPTLAMLVLPESRIEDWE